MGSPQSVRRSGVAVLASTGFALAALTLALPAGTDGLLALALVITLGIAVDAALTGSLVRVAPPAGPARIRVVASRESNRHTAFLRLRDPAAPGRSRPRAPSPSSAAA